MTKSSPETPFKFAIGQRVAEKPKTFYTNKLPQRYGVVVEHKVKLQRGGTRRKFLLVQWDHLKQPTEHDQGRICAIEDFDKVVENFRNTMDNNYTRI